MTDRAQGRHPDFAQLRALVTADLRERLLAEDSPLVADTYVERELNAQVARILALTFSALRIPVPTRHGTGLHTGPVLLPTRGAEVGEHRARQNIHPADSLQAATILFDVALVRITAERLAVDGNAVEGNAVARALHEAIMANVIPASVAYVNVLLERLSVAHSEERLGISRELHDRVAHSIAAGIQRIDLSGVADETSTEHSLDRLHSAVALFAEALDETRAIALELRHLVGDKLLDEAVRDYVTDINTDGPLATVETVGTPFAFSNGVQEEAFIIIREAIHNARRHSGAATIEVVVTWSSKSVEIVVADDGHGFRHADIRSGAIGLIAAQERAELIGADLVIDPGYNTGTRVILSLPIAGATG